jgi:hypothetical protein
VVLRGRGAAVPRAAGAAHVLEPEEDDRDVVASARLVGRGDQVAAGLLEAGGPLQHGARTGLLDHPRQAVGAQQEDVAVAGAEDLHVDLDLRLRAERAGDDVALRMRLGLGLGELAAGDQLADQRVVAREPHEVAAAPQVGARVADVRHRHVGLADVGRRHRRAHAGELLVGVRALVDAAVGRADDVGQRLAGRPVRQLLLEGLDGHLGRHLAGLRAAHAVGDHEQRRADVVVVLVALALAAQVGGVELFGDAEHGVGRRYLSKVNWESPMRILSPGCSGCGPRKGSSLR